MLTATGVMVWGLSGVPSSGRLPGLGIVTQTPSFGGILRGCALLVLGWCPRAQLALAGAEHSSHVHCNLRMPFNF